jgi:DNA primase
LQSRNFIPEVLKEKWKIKGTGPIGDYKHRIIAPIYFNGVLVSYQGRDYTGKAERRYMACRKKDELIHHKNILYGIDRAKGSKCILVEGITDVWRLGDGAVGTFGIQYSDYQLVMLWERFNEIYIMFDDDPQAIRRAKTLGQELMTLFNLKVEICIIKGDPGGLPQSTADKYKRQLLGKNYLE